VDAEGLERELRVFLGELGVGDVERGEPLLSTGLLDSVELMRVANFLEARTGLAIPDRDVGEAHFDSIEAMIEYVEARRRQAGPQRR
jgi:acyl carrier protein